MVVFDTSSVLLLIDPNAGAPIDPATSKPTHRCKERIDFLLKQLSAQNTKILIPTPVLSEFLVKSGPNKNDYVQEFLRTTNFTVGSFDERAAIELAYLEDADLKSGRKLIGLSSKAKIKFDRQICAISKVYGATMIYTDDKDLGALSKQNGLQVTMTWEIPLPPEEAQQKLPLPEPGEK